MSEESQAREAETIRASFARHGHGFHYAAVKACLNLHQARKSRWALDATEFPVEVNGTNLHIDILLRSERGLLVIECKRVNPALSRWCFARSQFGSRSVSEPKAVRLEMAFWPQNAEGIVVQRPPPESSEDQYHVGLEVKGSGRGEASGHGRGALDDAVTQALRGASGIINVLAERREISLVGAHRSLRVIPVVLTTARLLTCDIDLAEANLETGDLPQHLDVTERPWLWYRVNPSPQLRASPQQMQLDRKPPATFGALADSDYARSVGIVSWLGLEEFLTAASFHIGEYF